MNKSKSTESEKNEEEVPHVHGPGCNHDHPKTIVRQDPKIGRNDPCLCGSGKKFKKCCG